jgi:predicted amidophosphoribosyltransferase
MNRSCSPHENSFFKLARNLSVVEKHVLLLDDIVTSGNTFKGVASKLIQLGAAQVTCLAKVKLNNLCKDEQ